MKKEFFQEPTPGQVLDGGNVRDITDCLAEQVMDMNPEDVLVYHGSVLPARARVFEHHGTLLPLPRYRSRQELLDGKMTPVQLRARAFDDIVPGSVFRGYSIKPVTGVNKETRVFPLVEMIKGARLYAYTLRLASDSVPEISFDPDRRQSFRTHGAPLVVDVPSTTKKRRRWQVRYTGVPVQDNEYKYEISYRINTTHFCEHKMWWMRQSPDDVQDPDQVLFCMHDVAAYMLIMDHYVREHKNLIPLQMSQFALPTQSTISFENRLASRVLITRPGSISPQKLNWQEREVLHWNRVALLGHDATFYPEEKLRDFDY